MYVRGQGSEEPKSPQESRQVFDKQYTTLEICRSKVPNKHVHGPVKGLTNAYRSSSRWHTRAWAQAVIRGVESDAVRRHEAYPAEDVEMDLTGADIPNDEFSEEPHVEEAKVPEEIPNAVRLAIMRHTSKELLCRALRFGGANKIAIRAASELMCDVCSENKPPKSHLPAKLADTYTELQSRCRSGSLCARGLK